jgi:hypothetical protein
MRASKTPIIVPIPTFSPRKSSSFDLLSLAQDWIGVEEFEVALEQFREIATDLSGDGVENKKE